MNRLILSIILLICFITAKAYDNEMQTFYGDVTSIIVNGKHFHDIKNQKFTIQKKSQFSATLTGVISKVGKMPGTLNFSIPIILKSDGTLSSTSEKKVGQIRLPLGMSKKLDKKLFKGYWSDNSLTFTIHVTSKILGMKMAEASFIFKTK